MRYYWICLCWILFYGSINFEASAQTIIQGQITDAQTGAPLPYVNIGVVDGSVGTVSGPSGVFTLIVPKNVPDSAVLRFSMIGYAAEERQWGNRPTSWMIQLTPTVEEIETITVVSCNSNNLKERGNKTTAPSATLGFMAGELGGEAVTKVRLKKNRKNQLMKLLFYVDDHPNDTLFYRVNVYSSKKNRPGENLLKQNIFVTTTVKDGIVEMDLSPYKLVYNQSVFIGLEYVRPMGTQEGNVVHFGGRFAGARSYLRLTSQSPWMRTPLLNLGYWVEVCEIP